MSKPKYADGTLVKYKVKGQWRYNNVVDSYYDNNTGVQMYSLDEPGANPQYRESRLHPVEKDEEQWLIRKVNNGTLVFGDTGYMYADDGEVYEQSSELSDNK